MSSSTPSTLSEPRSLFVYYGLGELRALERHRRVALQPGHHSASDLARLAGCGTETLAYLSLGEDASHGRPWQRRERNPLWGTHYVEVAHPAWQAHVVEAAVKALDLGFTGLFLDTLDTHDLYPDDREPLLDLARCLRAACPGYIVANRGFGLMNQLATVVDGFLFEGFSTTWEDGYQPLTRERLFANVEVAHDLQATRRDMYALDYADNDLLAAFARDRASAHGFMSLQVSNRELTLV